MPRNALLTGLCYVAAYVGLDYVSFIEAYQGHAITPWSPGQGLALAVVLLGGLRHAPAVLLAPVAAGFIVRSGSVPALVHVFEGLLIGGSYLAAGLYARAHGRLDLRLSSVRDVLILMLTAVAAAAMAAGSYVGTLGWAGFLAAWQVAEGFLRFLVGDLIGCLVVTPLVLLIFSRPRWPLPNWETALQIAATVLALVAIFALPHASAYQLFYLLFVPLLWSTLRAGLAGASLALAVIQVGLVIAIRLSHGPGVELMSFQTLMISLAATGLVFGSLVGERQATLTRLAHQQLALSRALRLRSMGEVATTIAHEVNQPITSIKTFAGIARDAVASGQYESAMTAMGRIRSECDRASAIISSTRSLLRRQAARPQPMRTEQILGDLKELLLDRLEVGAIKLRTRVATGAETVVGDPVQLRQALYNILDNSIDAIAGAGTGGTITVDVHAEDPGSIEFAIRDTGPGFPRDVIDRAPVPLVTTKPDGTGIGLSVARSVAEAHGGGLSIEHGQPGSVVKLRLKNESVPA